MIRLFRVFVPVGSVTLLISEALLLVWAYVIATCFVMSVDPAVFLLDDGGLARIFVVSACILSGIYFQDLYTIIRVKSRILLVQQLLFVTGIAFLIQGLISYLSPDLRVPIRVMILGSAIAVCAVFLWRMIFGAFLLRVVGQERLLLAGNSPLLDEIGREIEANPDFGLKVIGYVGAPKRAGGQLPEGKLLGPLTALREIVEAVRPDRIVVGIDNDPLPAEDLLDLQFSGYVLDEATSVYERVSGRVCLNEIRPAQLIYSDVLAPRRKSLRYQNWMNLLVASAALAASLPLMLLAALAVRLSSPGPILCRQEFAGLGGLPITLYRFRSERADGGRLTAVGRFLRRTRLDELPQLFSVLMGAMSMVGPRAERPEFVQAICEQIPYYAQRMCVRPGITGWAQINSRGNLVDTATKLEWDLYYIKNMSLSLDTYILFHSLKSIFAPRGAQ
jgi:lipopolysaccharide/colanic/teichoic acid biosynthesis glycosyltransferase